MGKASVLIQDKGYVVAKAIKRKTRRNEVRYRNEEGGMSDYTLPLCTQCQYCEDDDNMRLKNRINTLWFVSACTLNKNVTKRVEV